MKIIRKYFKNVNQHIYNFDFKKEFSLYNDIGYSNATFKNYSEWHNYVLEKYHVYSQASFINFSHYLVEQHSNIEISKNIYNNSILPLITIVLSISMSLIFSLISVINNYNHDLYTAFDKDYMQQLGYNLDMLINTIDQALYSSIQFYLVGAFGAILLGVVFFIYFQKNFL
ncbi:MAG: hypothetical protein H2212_15960 [Ruminococcus sp.]|nr:hypothetical protein [Ruminococcus sp.]